MKAVFRTGRVAFIDLFRALTMLCMIFVNDLWSLRNVPHWLEHARTGEDFLGFSDVVFPAFLFAMGLSIPYAIESRLAKGDTRIRVAGHILLRTLALLVMGVFTVNTEAGLSPAAGLSKPVFVILMVAAFFLVWNVYPKATAPKKHLFTALKAAGVVLLAVLAIIYRDGNGEIMQQRWWGILGLIGWTYFLCAIIYLFAIHGRIGVQLVVLTVFMLISMAGANGWLGSFSNIIVSNGALHCLSMAGIAVSLLFNRYQATAQARAIPVILVGAGITLLVAGLAARHFWIISKISATPTWVLLCMGISLLLYLLLRWLVEAKKKEHWFAVIRPAGTATLTCYLIPYIIYSLFGILDVSFPDAVTMCPVGLLKSLAFAFAVIGVTALLGKAGIRLKI